MLIKKITGVLSALAFVLAAGLGTASNAEAGEVQMSFFGNQHFRFVSNEGKVILINPWVKGNKDAGITVESFKKGSVDLILTTSGHGDDQGQAVEIAARTGATIFTVAELGSYMQSRIEKFGGSKKQIYRGAIGGRTKVGGVTVQLIQSAHGSGTKPPAGGGPGWIYGGPASGAIITFENGLRVLMAGSTGLTMDLQLFGMRYKPHVVMVPVMGRFMMHPDDAAFAVKLLMTDNPNLKTAIPQHVRYKGAYPWMGTGKQFEAEVKKLGLNVKVLIPTPGKVYTLSK
jgi:L-ascorbate metabolism protein UlaG (beta-lactamase superfamily)